MLKQNDTTHTPLILVADDQLPTAQMLERVFLYEGYRVHKTADGLETLDAIQKLSPDLILLDINMPGMTGFDILKQMRDNPRTARIPTIIITAMGDLNNVVHGLNLGADDYLKKPFHPQELLARAKAKIRASQLEAQLYQKTLELESLLRLGEELSLYPESGDLLHFVVHLIADLVPNRAIQVVQLNPDRNRETATHYANFETKQSFPFADYLQKHIEQDKDIIQWENMDELAGHHYATTGLLRSSNDVLGMLILGSDMPYTDTQFRLFNGICRQIALAFRKNELYHIQQRYANHLEEMVEQRTVELESAQKLLIRSEKLASIGRIAGEIAHEIKNPLMPIRICLDNTKEDIEDGIYNGDIGMVNMAFESIERINYIVDSLRAFMGNKQVENVQFSPININQLIEQISSFNQRVLDDIRIETYSTPTSPILGNRFQLEQVFQNLIINARDAMPDGGTLKISIEQHKKDVVIQVADTGKGIPKDIIESIFEPFISTKEEGNGLGLFISYGIIKKHNGHIEVQSAIDKGTVFTIRLPIAP